MTDPRLKLLLADITKTVTGKKKAADIAKAVYAVCRKHAEAEGQTPDIEVAIKEPGQPRHFPTENSWCVIWEAGPFEWAIPASYAVCAATGKLCEPYYSFDLCFYPTED